MTLHHNVKVTYSKST